jgi:hypothetical protein
MNRLFNTKAIQFYLLRLRQSSAQELIYRAGQVGLAGYLGLLGKFTMLPFQVPPVRKDVLSRLIQPTLKADVLTEPVPSVRAVVDSGEFAGNTGERSGGGRCGNDDCQAAQDIRSLWEPARLQDVTVGLLAARQMTDPIRRRDCQRRALDRVLDWISDNPFARGLHYHSVMECALRVPVFFMVLKEVDPIETEAWASITSAIYGHGWLISKRLSLHASLGNHTIAESVGLVFAGAIFGHTHTGRRWLKIGMDLLSRELCHQILADGGPAEQSLSYHRFVLDLYHLAADFIEANDLGDVACWKDRLTQGERFLDAFSFNGTGQRPDIGDSDDGFAVAPTVHPVRPVIEATHERLTTYSASGYSIVRKQGLHLTFDHGPLGMAPFYNHGHSDALSVTLTNNGKPFLIDPGTYRYNGVPVWRQYFKGTRAHNTVVVDNCDQATQETSFIWCQPYSSRLLHCCESAEHVFLTAEHDGYARLPEPVYHIRSIGLFDRTGIIIKDRFRGTGKHRFVLCFHLHPDVAVQRKGAGLMLENGQNHIWLCSPDGVVEVLNGSRDPLWGWFSEKYGQIESTHVLTLTKKGCVDHVTFTTALFTQ